MHPKSWATPLRTSGRPCATPLMDLNRTGPEQRLPRRTETQPGQSDVTRKLPNTCSPRARGVADEVGASLRPPRHQLMDCCLQCPVARYLAACYLRTPVKPALRCELVEILVGICSYSGLGSTVGERKCGVFCAFSEALSLTKRGGPWMTRRCGTAWWAIVQILGAAGLGSWTQFWCRGRARSGLFLLWTAMLGVRRLPLGIPFAPTDLAPALPAHVCGRLPQTSRRLPVLDGRGFLSCGGNLARPNPIHESTHLRRSTIRRPRFCSSVRPASTQR